MSTFGSVPIVPSEPDWGRLRRAAWLGVVRRLLRIRVGAVVGRVVLALVPEESGHQFKDELERVRRFTWIRVVGTTAVESKLRDVLFELHVLPGAESTVVSHLHQVAPYARVSRLPRTRPEAESALGDPSLLVQQWLVDKIATLRGGSGAGTTIVVFDRGFDQRILEQIQRDTSVTQLPVLQEFAHPLKSRVPNHGAAVLLLAHLAAPEASLQWQFEPRTPDVSVWRRSDRASRVWLPAYVSMIRDLHTEGGYPRTLKAPVVVNLSLSWSFGDAPGADESDLAAIFDSILAPAVADGILFVAAAGNAPPLSPMAYPAISSKVIGVGALDHGGRPAAGSRAGGKSGLWLMAPGGGFGPQTHADPIAVVHERPLAGTSYATAIASGLVASAFSADGQEAPLQAREVRELLQERALPYEGWDPESGCAGLINIRIRPDL